MKSPFVLWVVDYLVNSAWQVPLLLLAAMVAARLTKQMGAGTVHRVWVGALLLAVVLPGCGGASVRGIVEVIGAALLGLSAGTGNGEVRVESGPGVSGVAAAIHWPPALLMAVCLIWVASLLWGGARLVRSLWRVRKMTRNAVAPVLGEDEQRRWDAVRARMGGAGARLGVASGACGPLVAGIRRPWLLVPREFFLRVEPGDQDAALAHELAHVVRRDYGKNLVYSALMLPILYHPCAWLVRSNMTASREMACDAMAAAAIGGGKKYARSLLRLAAAAPFALRASPVPAVGIFDGNSLERRVTTMMDKRKQLSGLGRAAAITAVALLTVGAGASTVAMHLDVQAADAAAGNTRTLSVKGSVMEGNILTRVQPTYPTKAKAEHMQGTCTLGGVIDTAGVPTHLHVVKSAGKLLDESALTAVRQWRYKPYLLNGDPVQVKTTVNITYSLDK